LGIFDYFKPVPIWPAEKVREFLRGDHPDNYNLLDVRQPEEYARGHIPGARLVPVKELFELKGELDQQKLTIVYCSSGIRSRAAASILIRAGFSETVCMEGGFKGWHGQLARGLPEMAMAWFFPAETPEQFVALAWYLEEGTRQFYSRVAMLFKTPEVRAFYDGLVRDEEGHQAALRELYEKFVGHPAGEDFPFGVVELPQTEPVMEGVVAVDGALSWAQGKSEQDILELTMSIEAVAYERYLFMLQKLHGKEEQRVFRLLAAAEKQHLEKVTAWFEQMAIGEGASV
jgi:sulfur-carrier protein adenylyltransferase/sulfurtransferase